MTVYVAAGVPAGTVSVPLALIATPVSPPVAVIKGVTAAGAKAAPFSVSFVNTVTVVPPACPLTGKAEKSSSLATIVAALTTTVTSAVSQFAGVATSQIW